MDYKNINPIKWTEQFNLGIPQIDKDHKKLVSLANFCIDELNNPFPDNTEIRNILNELIKHTQYHFQREELLMKVCEYPDLIKHQQEHKQLIKNVILRIKEYYLGKITAETLLTFLTDWLISHIMTMDKEIIPYYDKKDSHFEQALNNTEINTLTPP